MDKEEKNRREVYSIREVFFSLRGQYCTSYRKVLQLDLTDLTYTSDRYCTMTLNSMSRC